MSGSKKGRKGKKTSRPFSWHEFSQFYNADCSTLGMNKESRRRNCFA